MGPEEPPDLSPGEDSPFSPSSQDNSCNKVSAVFTINDTTTKSTNFATLTDKAKPTFSCRSSGTHSWVLPPWPSSFPVLYSLPDPASPCLDPAAPPRGHLWKDTLIWRISEEHDLLLTKRIYSHGLKLCYLSGLMMNSDNLFHHEWVIQHKGWFAFHCVNENVIYGSKQTVWTNCMLTL